MKSHRKNTRKFRKNTRNLSLHNTQERERLANEYRARYQEEQRRKHEVAAQRVAEAKRIQREVRMPEVSGSGRNGDADVSSPSPSPAYIRLIRRQTARVSGSEMETKFFINGIGNREKLGASGRARVAHVLPAGSLASVRTARPLVTGAGNGRLRVTCPGGSRAGRRQSARAGPSSIPMRMRKASQSRSGGRLMLFRWWRSGSRRPGHCPFSGT